MKTVKSRKYFNQRLCLNSGVIEFKSGVAHIEDEQFEEIISRKLPNIYEEGKEPEYRTKIEEKLREEVKEGNQEFLDEIKRLKNVIHAQEVELGKKDNEIATWKKIVDDMKTAAASNVQNILTQEPVKEEVKQEEKSEEGDILAEFRKELEAKKKEEIEAFAKSEDGGSFTDEDLKGKTKSAIIEMILEKA